jgi:hypothetical protein
MIAFVLALQLSANWCSCCCCSWAFEERTEPRKVEVPPPPAAPAPPAPQPVDALVLSTIASGRLRDVVDQLPDGVQRVRLENVLQAMERFGDARRAIAQAYGPNWAKSLFRDEIVAILVAHDPPTRRMLASASRAEVEISWPDGPDTIAADKFRLALRRAFPAAAIDDGVDGWRLEHTLRFDGESKRENDVIQGTKMHSYQFTTFAKLYDERGNIVLQYPETMQLLGISPRNAQAAIKQGDRVFDTLAGHVVGHILTETELSVEH